MAVVALLWHTSAAANLIPQCLLGRWKSDEARTLAEVRLNPEVTPQARAVFENGLLGKLVIIFGPRWSGGYLEGRQDRSTISFEPYDVVESSAAGVALRTQVQGVTLTNRWFCEGNAIYTLTTRWGIREYFSPLQ